MSHVLVGVNNDAEVHAVDMGVSAEDLNAALQVADYGYVLETGELAIEGESAVLAREPRVAATYLGQAAGNAAR